MRLRASWSPSTTTSTSRQSSGQLPPPVDRLAGPISAGLRQVADEAANRALARPEGSNALGGGEQDRTRAHAAVIDDEARR